MIESILAQADSANFWNQILSGQVGFILATVMFGAFFWRVLIPEWRRNTRAIEKLADAVRLLVVNYMEREGKTNGDILKAMDEIGGHTEGEKE